MADSGTSAVPPPPPSPASPPPAGVLTAGDEEHLRLLSIFHYVVGGLVCLLGLFPLIHVAMGLVFMFGSMGPAAVPPVPEVVGEVGEVDVFGEGEGGAERGTEPFPEQVVFRGMGALFVVMGLGVMAMMQGLGVCTIIAGRRLAQRRSRTFCFVVAALLCMFMPVGTALGVFTIIVLCRPQMREAFGG